MVEFYAAYRPKNSNQQPSDIGLMRKGEHTYVACGDLGCPTPTLTQKRHRRNESHSRLYLSLEVVFSQVKSDRKSQVVL